MPTTGGTRGSDGVMGRNAEAVLENEAYYTEPGLARLICERMHKVEPNPIAIIEPSAGAGAFVFAAMSVWQDTPIVSIEPNDRSISSIPPTASCVGKVMGRCVM